MRIRTTLKELFKELRVNGYHYKNSDHVFNQKSIDPTVVNLILKWIPKIYDEDPADGDMLVRSLKIAKEYFAPDLLIKLFEESDLNSAFKGGIGRAIVHSKTGDISKWLRNQLLDKEYAFERRSLVEGLPKRGGFEDDDELKEFLELIFEKYAFQVLNLYDKIGDKHDFDFLLEQMKTSDKEVKKEIQRTMRKILKREGIKKQ